MCRNTDLNSLSTIRPHVSLLFVVTITFLWVLLCNVHTHSCPRLIAEDLFRPYTMISSTKFLIPSIQCALPVTTIMDIWQLQHMGTGCTVTHLRFHNRVTKAGQLQAPRDTFIDKMSLNKALLKVNSSRLLGTNKVNIYRNKHNYSKTVRTDPPTPFPPWHRFLRIFLCVCKQTFF